MINGFEVVATSDYDNDLFVVVGDGQWVSAYDVDFPLTHSPHTRVVVVDLDFEETGLLNETTDDELAAALTQAAGGLVDRYCRVDRVLPGGIWCRSSFSGGLHGWFSLPEPMDVDIVYRRVEELLWTVGLQIEPGRVEVFPNLTRGRIRLPWGAGSRLVDQFLKFSHQDTVSEQVRGWLHAIDAQVTPPALLRRPIQSTEGECRDWHWSAALAHAIQRGDRDGANFWIEREQQSEADQRMRLPSAAKQARPVLASSATPTEGVPQLIESGERSWRDRAVIARRAILELRRRGYVSAEAAREELRRWLLDQRNSQHSKSLSDASEREGRVHDLVRAVELRWSYHGASPAQAAALLSPAVRKMMTRLAGQYLSLFRPRKRPGTLECITQVLLELAALEARGGDVTYAGIEFWTHSGDGVKRLNRRAQATNPKYYGNLRLFLVWRGFLRVVCDDWVQGVRTKGYEIRLLQLCVSSDSE
ncbi:MAG: hypothetical protein KC503_34050 [Myxococcales bacterium]|nr:hypothetical protein [Myxococcales bacterium]